MKQLKHFFEIGSANIKFQFSDENFFWSNCIKISCDNYYYRRITKKISEKITYNKIMNIFGNILFPWTAEFYVLTRMSI